MRLRDAKGLHDLAALLAQPGGSWPCTSWPAGPAASSPSSWPTGPPSRPTGAGSSSWRRSWPTAAADHDPRRGELATLERDALLDELAAVTGLGGRPRQAGSDTERMRKAVGNRIRQALGRIADVHPELGRHLRVSVRTGTFCRYQPDREVRWRL